MRFQKQGHTGPHTGPRTGPRNGPHTGPTATPARLPGVSPGQPGYVPVGDSPTYIPGGREVGGARQEAPGQGRKAPGLWSDHGLNTVPEQAAPPGHRPRRQRRGATEDIGTTTVAPVRTAGALVASDLSEPVPRWSKTVRLSERWTVTEKIDGVHAIVVIEPADTTVSERPGLSLADGPAGQPVTVRAASRTRWLVPEPEAATGVGRDNFGFAVWVAAHATELAMLGPGAHHGEWYGPGIGHGYGLAERRFALFDTDRWPRGLPETTPEEVRVVPVLAQCDGTELNTVIAQCLSRLAKQGSRLVAGAAAEGVIARSAADPRLALKAYVEAPASVAVQSRSGFHAA